MTGKNQIDVEIFNQKFTLYSDEQSEAHIKKLAQFVDSEMREIYQKTKLSSALKIAILTALNFADRLLANEVNEGNEDNSENINKLMDMIQKMEDIMKTNRIDQSE